MIRRSFILVIALLLCAVVWWIGPLIAIGTYRPLLSVWVRRHHHRPDPVLGAVAVRGDVFILGVPPRAGAGPG